MNAASDLVRFIFYSPLGKSELGEGSGLCAFLMKALDSSKISGRINNGITTNTNIAIGKKLRGPFNIGKNMLRTVKTRSKVENVKHRMNIIFDDFLHPRKNIATILQ
jgi:hypothetical protein